MKNIFTSMFTFLVFIVSNGQVISFGDPGFVGNKLSKVIEKSVKHPDSWREFTFNSNSKLIEKKSFRDFKEVENIKYDYLDNDSILITKEIINNIGLDVNIYIHKSYFDSNKRLLRYEYYSPEDTLIPFIVEENIIYNNNGKIESCVRKINNHNGIVLVLYKFEYSVDNSILTIKENNSASTVEFKYDHKGNIKDKIIDDHNPLSAIGGVRTWSKNRKDKYQISYKYDKFGNWVKSYSVTKFWKYRLDTRNIIYN